VRLRVISPSLNRADIVTTHKVVPWVEYAVGPEDTDAYTERDLPVWALPDGVKSIPVVRNYIMDHCGADWVLMVDDDLTGIGGFAEGKAFKLSMAECERIIYEGFQCAEQAGARLWGINMVSAPMAYREYTPFCFKAPVLGPFCGHILADNPIRYDSRLTLKEDWDFFIASMERHRRVVRMNWLHYVCDHLKAPGGCTMSRTMAHEMEQLDLLRRKWGSEIVQRDFAHSGKGGGPVSRRKLMDTSPRVRIPIAGV
jgi:hypothetical protein